jgi:FAD/FMN-containing dehydrogenase
VQAAVRAARSAGLPLSVLAGGHDWAGSAVRDGGLLAAMPATCALNVHHSHGAATRVPVTRTAYPYRDEHLVVEILGAWADGDGSSETSWVWDTGFRLDAHALPGGWANLMARGDRRARDAYGINTARLLAVKSHYDPDGVFAAIPLSE